MKKESRDKIEGRYLLLDTNVLIDAAKERKDFALFFHFLKELKVNSVADRTTKLEFMRGARTKAEMASFEVLLEAIQGKNRLELEIHKESFEKLYIKAKEISVITNSLGGKIKLGDALVGATLSLYSSQTIILATQNHGDFLPPLFKLIDCYTFRLKNGRIKSIGFYEYDVEEHKRLYELL